MGNNKFDMSILPGYARMQPEPQYPVMQSMQDWGKQAAPQMQANSPEEQQQINEFLQRLQVSGQIQQMQNGPANVMAGGGRVGYEFPVGQDNLTLGLQGGGYKVAVNTPQGIFKDAQFKVDGGDIGYQSGNNNFSLGYRYAPNDPMVKGKMFNLNYRRQF